MRKNKLTNQEIASFCSQMTMLISAGITPEESVRIMLGDTTERTAKEILEKILTVCQQGERFYTAIEKTQTFPDYVVNMIRLGEESGNLDNVMESLADYYEREDEIAEGIRGAITYPFIMVAMMIIVMLVLVAKVLPIFNQVFEQLGGEMTGISRSFLILGQNLNRYAAVVIIVLALLAICYLVATGTTWGQRKARSIFSAFPLTSGFFQRVAAGRFASGMALALGSGLDPFSGLNMVMDLVEHKETQEKIAQCKTDIEKGYDFAEAVSNSGIFYAVYNRMIMVGYKTGATDQIMKKIAVSYDREINKKMQSIISIIEPTLVIILAVIVGLILLSVILPLMGIMTSIG